jgi:Ca2+-binding EF-hand superfamily protein
MVTMNRLSSTELLEECFEKVDINHDDKISWEEFKVLAPARLRRANAVRDSRATLARRGHCAT